jgi:hypothetical protein
MAGEIELKPPSVAEVEQEAQRCRRILDDLPPNDFSDMLYASYTTLPHISRWRMCVMWGRLWGNTDSGLGLSRWQRAAGRRWCSPALCWLVLTARGSLAVRRLVGRV